MQVRSIFIILICFSIKIFAQQKKGLQPVSTQESLPFNMPKEKKNIEYKLALKEYEELIRKYPDKKELYYNLGNLNYLNGDSEVALQNIKIL